MRAPKSKRTVPSGRSEISRPEVIILTVIPQWRARRAGNMIAPYLQVHFLRFAACSQPGGKILNRKSRNKQLTRSNAHRPEQPMTSVRSCSSPWPWSPWPPWPASPWSAAPCGRSVAISAAAAAAEVSVWARVTLLHFVPAPSRQRGAAT